MSSSPETGPRFKPCPECGGRRVEVQDNMSPRRVLGYDTYAMFLIQNQRSSHKGKSNLSETLTLTCLQCGYTAWYACEPLNLLPDGQ